MNTKPATGKINVVTLGCARNIVDSEILVKQLEEQGMSVRHNSQTQEACTVIINTCGFIQDAKEESIDEILKHVQNKKKGKVDHIFVFGCLSERYKNELKREIPEVEGYFGVNEMQSLLREMGLDFKRELTGERKLSTPSHYAYLKISEGCDRKCSFCAIPMIRGPQVSRSIEELSNEAEKLSRSGVKELILIAQDLTAYGLDLYGKRELAGLLDRLLEIDKIDWIRLHYAYPLAFPENVLERIRNNHRICNYLDIPFQHISDPVLKNMKRGITRAETLKLIDKIRRELGEVSLRTTLITGHPGEGVKEFEELKEFVKRTRFERLGAFVYSEEEGTWGAQNLRDNISAKEKRFRLEEIMQIQQSISLEINQGRIGRVLQVMVDSQEGDYYIGRTEYDSPEVDNEVLIKSNTPLPVGEFTNVHITGAGEFDLTGYAV